MGMTDRDKKLMIVVLTVVLLGGFWLLVLGPKRAAVKTASEERDTAAQALAEAKTAASAGKQEKKVYRVSYAQLVRLGKAVPVETDEGTLIVQVVDVASDSGVDFTKLVVTEGAEAGAVPGATGANGAATPTTCDSGASGATGTTPGASSAVGDTINKAREGASTASGDAGRASGSNTETSNCATAPTPTDLAAAGAGLQLDSFDLTFKGSFFKLHKFLENMYDLVENRNGKVKVTGRLFQISGIDFKVDGFPTLEANVKMTGYRLPADVSATAGATPGGPAPASTPTSTGGVR